MDLLIGLVVLAVVGLMVLGFFGLVGLGIGAAGSKGQAQREADQAAKMFDGSQETVVYTVTMATPPPAKVVPAATEHGYRLVSQSGQGLGQTFVFERDPERASADPGP